MYLIKNLKKQQQIFFQNFHKFSIQGYVAEFEKKIKKTCQTMNSAGHFYRKNLKKRKKSEILKSYLRVRSILQICPLNAFCLGRSSFESL